MSMKSLSYDVHTKSLEAVLSRVKQVVSRSGDFVNESTVMASSQSNHAAEEVREKTCTILITGFAPFQEKFPINPSWEIARLLPENVPGSKNHPTPIRLLIHPEAIHVGYKHVRELVPALLESYSETIDMVLHIGMASGRTWYALERLAHRDGYENADIDGHRLPAAHGELEFGDCPLELTTTLEHADVMARWRENVAGLTFYDGVDVRPSDDPGRYLCDYIFLNSLAWYRRKAAKATDQGEEQVDRRPVLFLHVPADSDEVSLKKGRNVAVALVRAMAESLVQSTSIEGGSTAQGSG